MGMVNYVSLLEGNMQQRDNSTADFSSNVFRFFFYYSKYVCT